MAPRMSRSRDAPKQFGECMNVLVAPLANAIPIRTFLSQVGSDCRVVERFLNKERLHFTGNVSASAMEAFHIRERRNFRVELRTTNVLVLALCGKSSLTLEEAIEIVYRSPLSDEMHLIKAVAVAQPAHAKNAPSNGLTHVYVQFSDHSTALSMVNSVDAMPYKGFYVHSPQISRHKMEEGGRHNKQLIWANPHYQRMPILRTPSMCSNPPPLDDDEMSLPDESACSQGSVSPPPSAPSLCHASIGSTTPPTTVMNVPYVTCVGQPVQFCVWMPAPFLVM
eukprot:TRINITY_DN23645_c1_g1_i2.p1 TRINITY_DN23645_c1_g1~~TRINITY_DN23645_c1_g1_i2.p1  ORF type:complete len:280 (+),score=58.77 TRINITY_DN23645_c1_g1_i2:301-1140(+)